MRHHQPKVYLAGPEVFLPNAREYANMQRQLCAKYGLIALHPMDHEIDLAEGGIKTAMRIWWGDTGQIRECHIITANCNPFRGICMDDGTANELGFGAALGKIMYGYLREKIPLTARTMRDLRCGPIDSDGYAVTDDFGTSINLMMECGIVASGGQLIEGDYEDSLRAIRRDLDTGRISIHL